MKRALRIIVVVLCLVVVVILLLLVSHRFLYSSPSDDVSHRLMVVTYNTHQMGGGKKAEKNEVIRYLQDVEADVLCLQEVEVSKNSKWLTLPELRQALSRYSYTYFDFKVYNHRRQYGNVVFSRYPLVNKHTIRYPSRGNISSCCDVIVKGDTLRLITNHLESYRLTGSDMDSLWKHPFEQDTVLRGRMRLSNRTRLQQARIVRDTVCASPYPVLVVGDFNAIPLSTTYLTLRGLMPSGWFRGCGLRDAFLASSNGRLGNTLYKRGRGIRIDYILHSPCLYATECYVDQTTGSDHLPVVATFNW